ncbi:MAG: T9SS type A sorting domain-containing protein [Salinivirgaceae bacterium]|nr:T9SS type A sorting domain-containing protein [Salinivirgaceae bacterium]
MKLVLITKKDPLSKPNCYTLFDISGRIVKCGKILESKVSFDISNYSAGSYYLRLSNISSKYSKTLIIQKLN